ncbi:MAG: SpoIIE family protein phosphatase [Planctomycetota bacterium]|jgi:serine phosphatase RsbU (regulator of sigma subunit)/pSer/pThr/pTyr-binding forkhead associated (FHA) protein
MATTTKVEANDLVLEPLGERGGGEVGSPVVSGDGPALIGRSRDADICLPDPSVSRRHASMVKREGQWFVTDLGGRHGTTINGVRVEPNQPAVAAEGDFIRIGPYTFRLSFGPVKASTIVKTDHDVGADTIVERVPNREIGSLAQRRLELLCDGAVTIQQASDEQRLALAVVQLALAGTGFHRAAIIRPTGSAGDVEVLASRDLKAAKGEAFSFSRSLLDEAASGHIARMSRRGGEQLGQSIERLGIIGALCAPIVLDEAVVGYIYLDSRESEQQGYADAVGFCHAVSRLAGLALSDIKRGELQQRQSRLMEDLKGAREAQAFLCPKGEGSFGRVRYAMKTHPGRFVAGDLFDIYELESGQVGICFGDVTGQGVAAAIHMTAVLSALRAALARYGDPGRAIKDVNRYIAERSPDHMFVSLWVGVCDGVNGLLRYVDAGHGHWFIKRSREAPVEAGRPGGLLVGIDPEYPYEPEALALRPHDRIIIYSDGVIEQTNPRGEAFEKRRVLEILQRTGSSAEDVSALVDAVREHAAFHLDDDTTVASIELVG